MKPFRTDNQLTSIPTNGLVEIFQSTSTTDSSAPQVISAGLFGTLADVTEQIAGGTQETPDATADGLTTGLVAATSQNVVYTVATDANDILSLPAAIDGKTIRLTGPGAELRSVVASDKINNVVVGATNEAAIVAGVMYTLVYESATSNWRMTGVDAVGAVTTPVIPNAV